jgi:hypothetical protein
VYKPGRIDPVMYRKTATKQRQRSRLALRTILFVSAAGAVVVSALAFFLIHNFSAERSTAMGTPMIISNITAFQEVNDAFRGTTNHPILGIRIDTRGSGHKLTITEIVLSGRGSSIEAPECLQNIRIWSTGSEEVFTTNRQLGKTTGQFDLENFTIPLTHLLNEGKNIIWITADVNGPVSTGNTFADAELISLRIGTLIHEPSVSAPAGRIQIRNNVPYYSVSGGEIADLKNWNSKRDGSGHMPENFNNQLSSFHVQPGYHMTNNVGAFIPTLIIEPGAGIRSEATVVADHMQVRNGGTFIQTARLKNPDSIQLFEVLTGGNYIHANEGRIPGSKRLFHKKSTTTFNQISQDIFNDEISFGNLVINCDFHGKINMSRVLKHLRGDFEIRQTGQEGSVIAGADSVYIDGKLVVNGGRLIVASGSQRVVMTVTEGLIIKNGYFSDVTDGNGYLVITGTPHFFLLGGEFKFNSSKSCIRFTKVNSSWAQTEGADIRLPDIQIEDQATLTIKSEQMGPVSESSELRVETGGKLHCEYGEIHGQGTFRVKQGALLSTSHREGINIDGKTGCIQTGRRYFEDGCDFQFTGSITPQQFGNSTRQDQTLSLRHLIIRKSTIADVVMLQQNVRLRGSLFLQKGNLNKNGHQLIKAGMETSLR